MGRLLGRIWVGGTTTLIAFLAYTSQIFVIWPWYGRVLSIELLTLLGPFNSLVAMLFWNYYRCVMTDPGRVPDGWKPNFESEESYEVKRLTGKPRFCRSCNKHKPPRTHHCSTCRRCVLRMDHHCPWVNNCVGYYNYGHFIRFLFFVDISCIYLLTMLTKRSFDAMNRPYWQAPTGAEMVLLILNFAGCIPVTMAVGGFSIYHFYCLCTNTTTIESWEKDKVAMLIRRGKIHEVQYPYNLGTKRNITSMLGSNPLLWCWPSVPPGTGLEYEVSSGIVVHAEMTRGYKKYFDAQHSWPPRDPTIFHTHQDFSRRARVDDDNDEDDGDGDGDKTPEEFTPRFSSTPWTYKNGSVNPNLEASNAYRRRAYKSNKRSKQSKADVPPYHPDYNPDLPASNPDGNLQQGNYADDVSASSLDSNDFAFQEARPRIRRGSEGYEIKPVDREEILRRYILSRGEEVGYYERYVPEGGGENEEGSESGGDGDGDGEGENGEYKYPVDADGDVGENDEDQPLIHHLHSEGIVSADT